MVFKKIKFLIVFLLAFFLWNNAKPVLAGELNFHAVFIGRGDALVLESKGHYMIVDSGTPSTSMVFTNYLKDLNIPNYDIDYVVATHPDGDHVGGFYNVFKNFNVKKVFYSPCSKQNTSYFRFINYALAENCPIETPVNNQTWKLGDATVTVVYDGSKGSTYNECSIVLKVTCDKKSILLTGDLPSTMENELLKKNKGILKSDILKVGHHGAALSSCADFLDAVSPKMAIISSDKPDKTNLPKDSVLMRLARRFINVYRTSDANVLINIKDGIITTKNKTNNKYTTIKKGILQLSKSTYIANETKKTPSVKLYVNGVLVPSSEYTVKYTENVQPGTATVKVTGNEKKYISSISKTFKILPGNANFKSFDRFSKSINLHWKKAKGDITSYTIKYSKKSDMSDAKTVSANKNKTSKLISGLKIKTKYYFQIRANYNKLHGNWSDVISQKTKKTPAPKQPRILSRIPHIKHCAMLYFSRWSTDISTHYELQYSLSPKFKKAKTYKVKKLFKKTKPLKYKRRYYARIRECTPGRKSKWSKTYIFLVNW